MASAFDPHVLAGRGPWFEGWYLRITSPQTLGTYGVIVGSYQSSRTTRDVALANGLPGYVAILAARNGGPLRVWESFPKETRMIQGGERVRRDPDRASAPDFLWEARENGDVIASVSEDSVRVHLPSGERFEAQLSERVAFSPHEFGPGGVVTFLRAFPLQWFVHSLGSQAKFQISAQDFELGTSELPAEGYAHYEKNWGTAFPKSYAWLQGITSRNDAQFAVAGGVPFSFGPFEAHAWLATLRVGQRQWYFAPQNGSVVPRSFVDSCKGKMTLELDGFEGRLYLEAAAQRSSFSDIQIPTEQGFIPASEQSFAANIRIRILPFAGTILPNGIASPPALVDVTFQDAALEFGGNYKCR